MRYAEGRPYMIWLAHVVGVLFLWLVIGASNALLSAPAAFGTNSRKDEWRVIVSGPIGAVKSLYKAYHREPTAVRK